jgi:hypothetical protein
MYDMGPTFGLEAQSMGDILSNKYVHFTGFLHTTYNFFAILEYNFVHLPATALDYISMMFTTSPMCLQLMKNAWHYDVYEYHHPGKSSIIAYALEY